MKVKILAAAVAMFALSFAVPAEAQTVACTITGTEGDDAIKGTWGNDVICGLGGNDTIYAWGGDDVVYGDDGDDYLHGEQGYDKLWGGSGNDYVVGGQWGDELHGGDGDDELWGDGAPVGGVTSDAGNPGIDTLYGDAGNDRLAGGTHRDGLHGGDGNDTIHRDMDGHFFGNAGDDTFDMCEYIGAGFGATGGRYFVNGGTGVDTAIGIPSDYWWQKVGTIENNVPCT